MPRHLATVLVASLLAGCSSQEVGEPETFWHYRREVRLPGRTRADLLVIVDSSASMASELECLPDQVRAMVRDLQDPRCDEGSLCPPGIQDLAVGLATARRGGRGELLWAAEAMESGCESDVRPLWDEAAEAAMAIEPRSGEARGLLDAAVDVLAGGSFGRESSLIAVVVITDGDDASPLSTEAFRDALFALRPGAEDLVDLGVVAGIPTDGSWTPGSLLEELRHLGDGPSCESERASATAPVRLAEATYLFGSNGTLESICRDDWRPVVWMMMRRLQPRYFLCVPERMAELPAARCQLTLVRDEACPCPPGSRDLGLDADARRTCAPSRGDAWWIDGSSPACELRGEAELVMPSLLELPPGSLRLECWDELYRYRPCSSM